MRSTAVSLSCIAAITITASTNAAIIRVDANATPGGDGTSSNWCFALTDLQDALDSADPGDEIWVADGTYLPGTASNSTFKLKEDVSLKGGFGGCGHPDPDGQDIEANVSVLSGDLGTATARHVVTADDSAIERDTEFQGFTITGGRAPNASGGGIRCIQSWPTIRECTITANESTGDEDGGGGIYCEGTRGPGALDFLVIRNCTISDYEAEGLGGGIFVNSRTFSNVPTGVAILNCEVLDNSVTDTADACGGGIHAELQNLTDPLVEVDVVSSRVAGNTSANEGGGVSAKSFETALTNGGPPIVLRLINSLVVDNSADNDGGGLFNFGAAMEVINCTVADNCADNDGGGYGSADFTSFDAATITNSIFWDNNAIGAGNEMSNDTGVDLTVRYTDVEGGESGIDGTATSWTDSYDLDPGFVSSTDYSLAFDSLLLGRADDGDIPADDHDVDEDLDATEVTPDVILNDRVAAVSPDLGAYEHQCAGDIDGSGDVGFTDLLEVLSDFGSCGTAAQPCRTDFHGPADGSSLYLDVGFAELVFILGAWGPCSASTTLHDELVNAGLTSSEADVLVDCIESGTKSEQENCACWAEHYIEDCVPSCPNLPDCPDDDPLSKH